MEVCSYLPTQLVCDALHQTIQKRRERQQISQSSFLTEAICVQMLQGANHKCANTSKLNCIHPTTKKGCSDYGRQFFVSVTEYNTKSFHIFLLHYLPTTDTVKVRIVSLHWSAFLVNAAGCSRTHFRKSGSLCTVYIISVVLQCPVNRVFCVYCMCGWGGPGVLSFQVNDDFDPCSSQILKPPAA